jgi:peptidylprolyl isomerase
MTETFDFFIFLGPEKSTRHLNGNYTIFGEVTKGMDIVEKISNVAHDEQDWPLTNVTLTAEIID